MNDPGYSLEGGDGAEEEAFSAILSSLYVGGAVGLREGRLSHWQRSTGQRLTLFDQLGKSPESGGSRQLIINSGKYGLTRGGVQAENIELTPEGQKAVDEQVTPREQARVRAELAITRIDRFRSSMRSLWATSFPPMLF
jgi:hypothetical protein